MNYIEHRFGPNDTIEAIIRLYNSHAMSSAVAQLFVTYYNNKNGIDIVPKVGDVVLIPVDERIARLQI